MSSLDGKIQADNLSRRQPASDELSLLCILPSLSASTNITSIDAADTKAMLEPPIEPVVPDA